MQTETTAKVTACLGAAGSLYFGYKFVRKCLEGREMDRYTEGCVAASKIYTKVGVGAGAVLAGAKLWEVLPKGVVPVWVVGLAAPIPFAMYGLKHRKTVFTIHNNTEYGAGLLIGCSLGGYFLGPFVKIAKDLRVLHPWMILTTSILAGHIISANASVNPLEALLQCSPASLSLASSLGYLILGPEQMALYGEAMLQVQVVGSALLSAHTYWCLHVGNPLHFDINTHALGILGVGVYTSWALLRMVIRTMTVPFQAAMEKNKYTKYFAEGASGAALFVAYIILSKLAIVTKQLSMHEKINIDI
eukprot:TRINITY_DN3386_c6_g1_i1.p1 TRINITY_DN3386_c6_g1~~TRINITY_DN3386_c6_g1_i1.p1  ORF type:complete len:310 (+),score=39.24 TRINITY_DN3386_c6_g1_i1:23-931(+)